MRFLSILFILLAINFSNMNAQEDADPELPYYEIPDYPENYTAGTVAARVLDGLGYRYYWATEGLKESDLKYKPSEDSREVLETLKHIRGLTRTSMMTIQGEAIEGGGSDEEMSFEEIRKETLEFIKTASDLLKSMKDSQVEGLNIVFKRGENTNEFPFWNLLNGPIADAIYHTGQIVSHRRASGNPLYPGVSVFRGKTRN